MSVSRCSGTDGSTCGLRPILKEYAVKLKDSIIAAAVAVTLGALTALFGAIFAKLL
jgi:hypothetical protein